MESRTPKISQLEGTVGVRDPQKGEPAQCVLDAPALERLNIVVQTEITSVGGRRE